MGRELDLGARAATGRRWRAIVGVVVATAALVVAGCGRHPRAPRKTQLARLPASPGAIVVADDAKSWAYVEKDGRGGRIVHDGVAGPSFALLGIPVFSPATHRLFYWSATTEQAFLVADGARIPGDFDRENQVAFSKDGTHWACAAATRWIGEGEDAKPGPVVVLADDRVVGTYPDASIPSFTGDGGHLAYLVEADDDTTRLLVDGREQATFGAPDEPTCAARMKPRRRGPNPNFWPQFQTRYLADGSLLVMTRDAGGWGVYRGGTRIAAYPASVVMAHPDLPAGCPNAPAVASWTLTTAENAPVAAWWERLEGAEERWRVVVDGKPIDDVVCAKPWAIQPPELTADGHHVAYACAVTQPEERVFVVADGRRYEKHHDLWAYAWSDDGAHVAYGAYDEGAEGPWRYFVDGVAQGEGLSRVWRPRFEPGTDRLAWQRKRGEDDRGEVGIGNVTLASFDDVLWGPGFLRPGTVTWVIRRGRRLVRLDVPTR